jgi:ABC-2 type transport system ATP-binding protein
MELAEKLCEEILLLNRGKDVCQGKLSEIKRTFGGNNIKLGYNGNGEFIDTLPEVIKTNHYKNYSEIQLADNVVPSEFIKKIITRVEVNHFSIIEPTLNKIFIDLIKEN